MYRYIFPSQYSFNLYMELNFNYNEIHLTH